MTKNEWAILSRWHIINNFGKNCPTICLKECLQCPDTIDWATTWASGIYWNGSVYVCACLEENATNRSMIGMLAPSPSWDQPHRVNAFFLQQKQLIFSYCVILPLFVYSFSVTHEAAIIYQIKNNKSIQ